MLIVHGHSDLTEQSETIARTFGTRVAAVGLSGNAGVYSVAVVDADGRRRQLLDVLERSSQEVGQPLPEEQGEKHLTPESALALFERLTGVGLGDVQASEFRVLRPAQEHDETEERPFIKRLFGLH